jgi:hypothetical protein
MREKKDPLTFYEVEGGRKTASDLQANAETGWCNGSRVIRSIRCFSVLLGLDPCVQTVN